MAYTGKQERNGAVGSGGEQNSAQPGPNYTGDISAAASQSMAAADARKQDTAGFMTAPQGSGIGGHTVSYEWDHGLAVQEMPGEA